MSLAQVVSPKTCQQNQELRGTIEPQQSVSILFNQLYFKDPWQSESPVTKKCCGEDREVDTGTSWRLAVSRQG